jgi:hypothetical protein
VRAIGALLDLLVTLILMLFGFGAFAWGVLVAVQATDVPPIHVLVGGAMCAAGCLGIIAVSRLADGSDR